MVTAFRLCYKLCKFKNLSDQIEALKYVVNAAEPRMKLSEIEIKTPELDTVIENLL